MIFGHGANDPNKYAFSRAAMPANDNQLSDDSYNLSGNSAGRIITGKSSHWQRFVNNIGVM